MAITVFDAICLTTGDTKHLYHSYSGCIQFKLLRPRASEFKPDTSLVDVIQLLYTFIYSAHLLKGQLKQQYHIITPDAYMQYTQLYVHENTYITRAHVIPHPRICQNKFPGKLIAVYTSGLGRIRK